MNYINFSTLFQRQQGVSFPVLIELKHPEKPTWRFTSDSRDVEWMGNAYVSVPMGYKFPGSRDGVTQGGTLEIDLDQQRGKTNGEYEELLKWFDEADDLNTIGIVALINEQGKITPVSQITQQHGTATWDGSKITWTLGADDRMNMQANPWQFDTEALTG